jgi:glucose/arabinose dehydrogenase
VPSAAALTVLAAVLTVLLVGCADDQDSADAGRVPRPAEPRRASGEADRLTLERIATGYVRPTWVGGAPGDDSLYIAEQTGRLVRRAGSHEQVVIDLGPVTKVGGEQGLLGVAFAPDYARSGRVVLHHSDRRGDTRVIEVRVRDGRADPARARVLLTQKQPEENHNGGGIAFGPDGRLYVGLGDGGGAFDPGDHAQDAGSRLGKLLAADIDRPGAPRWEIVASGLRNPWRFAFDPALGEVWIGDVGQDEIEEVNRVYLEPDEPPKNFGWPAREGSSVLDAARLVGGGELIGPVAEYTHDGGGCSVIGGVVYRGTRIPALRQRYVYGDFCSGALWTVRPRPAGTVDQVEREGAQIPQLTHIGTDARGELVFAAASGELYRAGPAGAP